MNALRLECFGFENSYIAHESTYACSDDDEEYTVCALEEEWRTERVDSVFNSVNCTGSHHV